MAEQLKISEGGKAEKYQLLLRQIEEMRKVEDDFIALTANVASMIHDTFGFLWTGFYRVAANELILGPFQGPLACTRIKYGKGVCGTSWAQEKTLIVEDVEQFAGHIACSSDSRSEIVVPLRKGGKIIGVLDIDSREIGEFDQTDGIWLERICKVLTGE